LLSIAAAEVVNVGNSSFAIHHFIYADKTQPHRVSSAETAIELGESSRLLLTKIRSVLPLDAIEALYILREFCLSITMAD